MKISNNAERLILNGGPRKKCDPLWDPIYRGGPG